MRVSWVLVLGVMVGCASAGPERSRGDLAPLAESTLVIATVYAGGGNAGAPFDRDFVVIVNRGVGVVSTAGVSIQYASGAGSSGLGSTEATRTLLPEVSLEAGGAILITGASGVTGAPITVNDAQDDTPLALATSGGRLALVIGTEPLGCNGASIPCSEAAAQRVIDVVGWGNAAWAYGDPAPAMQNGNALQRLSDGCTDTAHNGDDFVLDAPRVRSLVDAARPCTAMDDAGGFGAVDTGLDAGVDARFDAGTDASGDAGDASDTGDANAVDASARADAFIQADAGGSVGPSLAMIQGEAHRSPLDGAQVERVRGIVSSAGDGRFSIESVDDALLLRRGLWVESRAHVAIGSIVEVGGVVRERRPDCTSCSESSSAFANLSVTTLVASSVVVLGTSTLDAPETTGQGGTELADAIGPFASPTDLEGAAALDDAQAIDFFERREGARIRLIAPITASATRSVGAGRHEIAVIADESLTQRDDDGRPVAPAPGRVGGRVMIVDGVGPALPMLDLGDRFAGVVDGVVDYERGRYVVRVTALSPAQRGMRTHQRASEERGVLSVASFNAHNLAATSPASRFAMIADTVVDSLHAPELVALQEIQDDDGAVDDGTTSAGRTLSTLRDAIAARGGPIYEAVDIAPEDGRDGGQPGANIRPALLVRLDGALRVVRRGAALTSSLARVVVRDGRASLDVSPARIGVGDPAFDSGRKPLVVELASDDGASRVLVVVAHLRSRLADSPRLGRFQPSSRASEAVRAAEAGAIAEFVRTVTAVERGASVVVLGDFNDTVESAALAPLRAAGLIDVFSAVPLSRRASYIFDGVGVGIDGLFATPGLAASASIAEVVHAHAEFAFGASDHDPIRVVFGEVPVESRAAGCATARSDTRMPPGVVISCLLSFAVAAARRRRRV